VKRACFILSALAVGIGAAQPVLAASPARQTRQRAERNLLGATHMVARWRVGFVDPKSGLMRLNTTAACSGRGRAVQHRYTHFECVLRYRTTVVDVLYVAQNGNGFEVRRVSKR
jgi:hypothetical protein